MQELDYYQQGDIIIKQSPISSSHLEKLGDKLDHLVLAEGEASGHFHKITSGKAFLYMLGTVMYLRVLEEARLFHDEHKPIDLPPGNYEIDTINEYDHFLEETRKVID